MEICGLMGYTIPPTATAGQTLTASDWNAKVRDSMEDLAKPPRCKVNRNAVQAVGHASISNVVWQNEEFDTANIWTSGTPSRLTIPVAGVYEAIFTAQYAINATGGRHFGIIKNGLGIATFNSVGSASWYIGGTVSAIAQCAAGDYLEAYAYHTAGVTLNIDTAYNITFSVHQISR